MIVGDQFCQITYQSQSHWGTDFGKGGPISRGPVLVGFSAKVGPARLILGGTDFGVTNPNIP